MQNTRSKRLLACFLTALGLSMNSMNSADVSAKNGQIRENIKFFLAIDCNKSRERYKLDILADEIQKFIEKKNEDNEFNDNGKIIRYSYIAENLYEIFEDIIKSREKYKCNEFNDNGKIIRYSYSDLANSLSKLKNSNNIDIMDEYPLNTSDHNKDDYNNKYTKDYKDYIMEKWLLRVAKCIYHNALKGGFFTVLDGKIKKVLPDFISELKKDLSNKSVVDFDWESRNIKFGVDSLESLNFDLSYS